MSGRLLLTCIFACLLPLLVFASDDNEKEWEVDSLTYVRVNEVFELYKQGVAAQDKADTLAAMRFYDEYLALNPNHEVLKPVEINMLHRYMDMAWHREDWEKICLLGRRLMRMSDETLEKYPYSGQMFTFYGFALNALDKHDDIDLVVQKGLKFVDKEFAPQETGFYDLRLIFVLVKIERNDFEAAKKMLDEIKEINELAGNHVADPIVDMLTKSLERGMESPMFKSRKEYVDKFARRIFDFVLLLIADREKVGEAMAMQEKEARIFLERAYFDADNVEDERIWSTFMFYYGALVNSLIQTADVPNKPELAYNFVLTSKNFLDWHSSTLIHKKVVTWTDVRDALDEDELAVELVAYGSEAIIVGRHYERPKIVEIDTLLTERIQNCDMKDPMEISRMYAADGPLSGLSDALAPYLENCRRIYISGSNHFAKLNWPLIPYRSKRLTDFYDVVPMITTADIKYNKSRGVGHTPAEVTLFGGMNYDEKPEPGEASSTRGAEHWAYLGSVPEELRKGYHYLPYTQAEIDSIEMLCGRYGVRCRKFTGMDAGEDRLKSLNYFSSEVLHIATHSFLLPSYGHVELNAMSKASGVSRLATVMSNSGLLFSGCNKSLADGASDGDDGILTAKEIAMLDLSEVGLVVLSACSTGLGELNNLSGIVYGLTNALKSAGAGQIMVSLWDVPDYVTSKLMFAFYGNLLSGMDARRSLRQAQDKLKDDGFMDPYYWAAFMILD